MASPARTRSRSGSRDGRESGMYGPTHAADTASATRTRLMTPRFMRNLSAREHAGEMDYSLGVAQSILVIDHDADLVRMLTQVAHSRGLAVVVAGSPAEAAAAASHQIFSVAIIDASIDPRGAV